MCLWTSNRAQDKCGTFYLTYDSKSDTGRHFGGQCQIPLAFPFFGKYKGEGVGIGIVLTRLPIEARASQACRHGWLVLPMDLQLFSMEIIFANGGDTISKYPQIMPPDQTKSDLSNITDTSKNWEFYFKWISIGVIQWLFHSSSKYVAFRKYSLRISLTHCYHVVCAVNAADWWKTQVLTTATYFLCFTYLGQMLNMALTYFLCGLISFVIISFI